MAELNTIYYNDPNRQLLVNNTTNEFIVSGYRLVVDNTLNRDLLIVTPPPAPTSAGKKGNIAFDKNYVYYCLEDNTWARSTLATWDTVKPAGLVSELEGGQKVVIPTPSQWWSFTNTSNANLGDYNFFNYGASFSSGGANIPQTTSIPRGTFGNCLLNYSANLVEPSTLNQSWSISFETKRLNVNGLHGGQFVLGSAFGKLGFHFEYTNSAGTLAGNHLSFRFSTHVRPFLSYQWAKVQTSNQILDQHYHQVVGVNDSFNKAVFLYFDGVLQGSGKYTTPNSMYDNPSFQGFGIGANPNGSSNSTVNSVEYNTPLVIKNMGFWKGLALTSGNVSALYNNGSFKAFPFS